MNTTSGYSTNIIHASAYVNMKHPEHHGALRGDRMIQLRKAAAMSQYDLADRLDMSQNLISRYEREAINPSLHTLKTMAALFNTTTDYLLGLSDIPHPGAEPDTMPALTEPEREMVEIMREHDLRTQRKLVQAFAMLRAVWQPNDGADDTG